MFDALLSVGVVEGALRLTRLLALLWEGQTVESRLCVIVGCGWFGVGCNVVCILDRCLGAVRQGQLDCFDDVWSDGGTEERGQVGEVGRRTLIIMTVVCAVAVHSKIAHFDKTKAKRRVAGEQACLSVLCHGLPCPVAGGKQGRQEGGQASGVPRYECQRYLGRLYRRNRMIPARP